MAYFAAHALLPVALGAGIYIGWRSTDLLVFHWIEAVGASDLVIRPPIRLPGWVLYSLPDGCWVYAYTSWMLQIWGRMVPWVFSGVLLAGGAELGQLFGFVPGTYDHADMVFYVAAFFLAWVAYAKTHVVDCRFANHGCVGVRERRQ